MCGVVEKAFGGRLVSLCGQQKIDRLTFLVHGPIEILPNAFDLDINFIHAPTHTNRTFVFAKYFFQQRQESGSPAVDRRVVDKHAAFFHHFFKVPVA